MTHYKKIYGLTGGIATGKSTVSKLLEARGFPLIDADKIAHELMEKGAPGYRKIIENFGREFLDQEENIDRKKLGAYVFKSQERLRILNEISHPLIFQEIKNQVEAGGQGDLVFLDVPLLFEEIEMFREFGIIFNRVILVYADEKTQLERLIKRDGLSEHLAWKKIRSQMDLEEKARRADFIIDNRGDLESLEKQLDDLLGQLE